MVHRNRDEPGRTGQDQDRLEGLGAPELSPDDIAEIEAEARRLHDAFEARTAAMELLTADDLKIRCR